MASVVRDFFYLLFIVTVGLCDYCVMTVTIKNILILSYRIL